MVSSRAPTVNVGGRAADSEADERATGGENADHLLTCNGDAPADQSRVADSADLRIGGAPRPPTSAGEDWSQSGPPSLSMSVDLHNLVSSYGQEAGSPPDKGAPNEEEESYEGFGYVRVDGDESPGGSSSAPSPTGANSFRNPRSPNSTIGRHSWLRTSLRRTPPCTNKKRLSSNALASQLYRSSSFNSSGRGSTCDNTEDMYSDVSLEDDVLDLNHRQSSKKKKNAEQNCPAEFQRCIEITTEPCLQRQEKERPATSSGKSRPTWTGSQDDEEDLDVIEIPRSRTIDTSTSTAGNINGTRSKLL